MKKFEQRFQGNPEYHILLLPVEAALPRFPEGEDTDKTPQEDTINEESEKKHRVSREELYSDVNCVNIAGVATFALQGVRPRTWWEAKKARKATIKAGLILFILFVLLILILLLTSYKIV